MKIYLIDSKKIQKYILPNKIEESFLISYKSSDEVEESLITIEAENEKWHLRSNGSTNILNGKDIINSIELKEYTQYYLKILGQDKYIMLYAAPTVDSVFYKINISGLNEITVGNDPKSNIFYNNNFAGKIQGRIVKDGESWFVEETEQTKVGTYNNWRRIVKQELKIGDTIFICGLKIIWMGNYIKINNPNNLVSVSGLSAFEKGQLLENDKIEPVNDEDCSINLYSDNDYFSHVPYIKEKIVFEEIEIDSPPPSQLSEDLPLALSLASSLTMLTSSFIMVYNIVSGIKSGKPVSNYITQIIMCVSMLIGSVFVPRIIQFYQKRKRRKKENLRQTKYKAYLEKKSKEIDVVLNKQTRVLFDNYPNIVECQEAVLKGTKNLWYRDILDNDFLKVRLGLGNIPTQLEITSPKEKFSLDEDNLLQDIYKVVDQAKLLKDVPITLSLTDNYKLAFVCNCSYKYQYINGIVTQLISLHSPTDLKIILLTDEQNAINWEYMKLLPHIWNDTHTTRFFATNDEECKNIFSVLEETYKINKETGGKTEASNNGDKIPNYKKYPTYYVIITDSYRTVKNNSLLNDILQDDDNYGFSFIAIADKMKNLPNKCDTFIDLGEKDGTILPKEIDVTSQVKFNNEYLENLDMSELCVHLSNIPYATKDEQMALPTLLPFMEMYGVSKIEQFNILNRWQKNNPVTSLAAPIGVHTNGDIFKLDLHEKFHGPHGLIAGSTGSGKSEFIITYILSMAVNYHPYEVQFVLIDYKGGGLAGAFENKETGTRIPHLAGTITNLDTSSMNRTLVSIESELKRRQRIFNEVRDSIGESTIDIYKYQRLYREGVVKEPMSHLFIISDEFAELKAQQPDFMQQLISTSRIGRALGVHLILATQKPSGVVNDQIWSNSKFKVCLKVQDRSDSNEVIKKPDAASLKDAGRFYLQVGYDDYFDMGQSAWGGAKYIPTDKIIRKIDDSIGFINNVGYVTKSINDELKKEETQNLGDQLTNIVKYIYNLSEKDDIHIKKLWLDPIPEKIYLNNLRTKYNYKPTSYRIDPIIGEYDKPNDQEQGLLNLNLTAGNILVYGEPGSGKENLLTTVIWSSIVEHTPEEVNFYIIDCGAETLKMFYKMPHVGEVVTAEEAPKVINTFDMIFEEIQNRKNLFADYAGSYTNYCENSGKKLPLIVTIINNYEIFTETFGNLVELIQPMIRDGSKYGLVFIVTASTTSSVRSRMIQYFETKIALQLPDASDYRTVINAPRNLFPAKFFGRGLIEKADTVVEFQTAMICDSKQLNNVIRNGAEQLSQSYKTRAKKILVIPEPITPDKFEIGSLDKMPIGYNAKTREISYYDFTQSAVSVILSNAISEKMEFLYSLIRQMTLIPDTLVTVIDFVKLFERKIPNIDLLSDDLDTLINKLSGLRNNGKKNIVFLIGISQYKKKLSPQVKDGFDQIMMSAGKNSNIEFVFADSYVPYKVVLTEPWYEQNVDSSSGIWLGVGVDAQVAISTINIGLEERKMNFPNMAFAVTNGQYVIVKTVIDMEVKNEK